ncbi:MAG: Ig-like domain-containing protein, partial [Solirubrobacterales bacterium]
APPDGTITADSSIAVTYTVTDNITASPTCNFASGSLRPLVAGSNTIIVTCSDQAGNSASDTVTVIRDNGNPIVSFSSPSANEHISSEDVDVAFSTTDASPLVVQCRVDSSSVGDFNPCLDTLELVDLDEGAHTVDVRATDTAGNSTTRSLTFTVDTILPVVTISAPLADAFVAATEVPTAFSATDVNPIVVECKIDSNDYEPCSSPRITDTLGQGQHTGYVRATDQAGNSEEASVDFVVDSIDPVPSLSLPSVNGNDFLNSSAASAEFSADDATEVTFTCKLDDGPFEVCAPPFALSALSEGEHAFEILATDQAGNDEGRSLTFTVDTIDPVVAVSAPAANQFFNTNHLNVSFSASDTNAIAPECKLDNGAYSPCTSPSALSGLTEGVHTSSVRATDPAGNTTTASVSFTVDTIAPAVVIASPAQGQLLLSSTVGVSFGASDATALTYECSAQGGAFTPCGSPFTISGLDDGTYYSIVRATDRAGNTGTGKVQFSVDLTSLDTAESYGRAKPKGKTPRRLTRRSKLIFRDEFSDAAINRRKWTTLRGTLKHPYASAYNVAKESATYSRDNVTVKKGKAVLTLKRKPAGEDPKHPYSSGMLHSGNHFSFKHGYVEARVKVPACSGCWPAFWMLNAPVDEEWPPEIDIFEYFNTLKDKRPKFNVHWKAGKRNKQWGSKKYGLKRRNYTKGWHTYGLAWNKRRAQVFIDGRPGPIYKTGRNLPKKANYLIFNLALQKGFKPRGER